MDIVRTLLPIQQQNATLSIVKQLINELEANCEGLSMLKELSPRMKDKIVCYGELLSSKIISATFAAKGIKQQWVDARELIKTDSNFLNAVVDKALTNKTIQDYFKNPANTFDLYIAPGFISSDKEGNTTTLGRGGSDYTGAIFAAALDAERLEIWTDVSGMMTADPRIVHNAKEIPQISYQEAMELSYFGASVLHPKTIGPIAQYHIPCLIKNTSNPSAPGTLISNENDQQKCVKAISNLDNLTMVDLLKSRMLFLQLKRQNKLTIKKSKFKT